MRAPDVLRLRFRPPLRLRLVDSAIRGREGLLRVGLWRPYIFVFRDLELVVTATSSTEVSEERRGHRRRLLQLIDEQVLLPLRSASARR